MFPLATTKVEDVARAVGSQLLLFERKERALTMSWDTGHMKVMAPYDSYHPIFALGAQASEVEIDPVAFMTAITKLRFCNPPATELRVPGLKIDVDGQMLTVTSTNGKAVGVMNAPMNNPSSAAGSFVLPVVLADDVFALLRENKSSPLVLRFYEKHLVASCGHRTYTTSYAMAGAAYPNIAPLFAKPTTVKAEFPIDTAKQALRRAVMASSYTHDESCRVRVALARYEIAIETLESREIIGGLYDGDPVSFIVNSKFLGGVFDAITTPSVELRGSSNAAPWLFTPKGSAEAQFVLAPMSAL